MLASQSTYWFNKPLRLLVWQQFNIPRRRERKKRDRAVGTSLNASKLQERKIHAMEKTMESKSSNNASTHFMGLVVGDNRALTRENLKCCTPTERLHLIILILNFVSTYLLYERAPVGLGMWVTKNRAHQRSSRFSAFSTQNNTTNLTQPQKLRSLEVKLQLCSSNITFWCLGN